jgi:uncharacterized protein (UPF0276 family)
MPAPDAPLRRTGIGLRAEHHAAFIAARPAVGFVEVHSENYFGRGGAMLQFLERVRRDWPLSLHGVGLSIGSTDPLDERYLRRLDALVRRFEPTLLSDHLCWTSVGGVHSNDLLPLPWTEEALDHVVERLQRVQGRLQRRLLIENPSSYFEYAASTMPEWEFLAEVSRRSGCGILLDVNNVYVSACNHGFDARRYLDALPVDAVAQIHLAGHVERRFDAGRILIDTHGASVTNAVWSLYRDALRRCGPVPTLIEWDTDLPPLSALLLEAAKADHLREACTAPAARSAAREDTDAVAA